MPFDLHTHFLPLDLAEAFRARTRPPWIENLADGSQRLHMPVGWIPYSDAFTDLDHRLRSMEETGVDRQLLSLPGLFGLDSLPTAEASPLLSLYNDGMAALAKTHGDRFRCLAALPLADMDAAVAEFRRARTLGLIGAILPVAGFESAATAEGLRPLLEAGNATGAHFFVHPGRRPDQVPEDGRAPSVDPFTDNSRHRRDLMVQNAVAHCMVTLLYSDLLGDYPDVSVHVANLGGTLPMVIERMDHMTAQLDAGASPPSDRAGTVHVDTASLGPRAIEIAAAFFGVERIMLGSDGPIFSAAKALEAVANANIAETGKRAILDGNAERLLARTGG